MNTEFYHHGILGMKWGVRRYQPYPKGHVGGKEVGEAARAKSLSKRKQRKAMHEAHNRASDKFNNHVMPRLNRTGRNLSTEEFNKRAMAEWDKVYDDEYRRVLAEYRGGRIKSKKHTTERNVSNGQIIVQGILAGTGTMLVSGLGQVAACKTGNEAVAEMLFRGGSLAGLAITGGTVARVVQNTRQQKNK